MTIAPGQITALRAAIGRAGFYPALVASAVTAPLGDEPVTAFLVHHDTAFLDSHGDTAAEPGMEMLRHITILALTPTRLIHSHTDEYQDKGDPAAPPRAETTTGSIPLARLTVTVCQRIPGPAAYDPATTIPAEVQLTIDWSSRWHAEGGQDHCDDDTCENFHGYLTLTGDDLALQVSHAAHGPAAITSALTFAAALARAASSAKPR
jgi:hypothetical protein